MSVETKVYGLTMTIKPAGVKAAVTSSTASVKFIVDLMKASVINILYHRLPLEDREVQTKWYNKKICYKAFKSGSKNSIVRRGHHCMAAIKDAIEKGYLKDFYLFFFNKQNGDVIENYKFSFNYFDEKKRSNVDPKTLETTTEDLLTTLNEMHTHQKLGPEHEFHVEISYFDDTPDEYEPPGCRPIDYSSTIEANLSKSGMSVQLVNVYTGFHRMKCKGRGEIFNMPVESSAASGIATAVDLGETSTNKNNDKEDNEQDNLLSQNVLDNLPDNFFTEDLTPINQIDEVNKTYTSFTSAKVNEITYLDISSDEEPEPVCLCDFKIDLLKKIDILVCSICEKKLHAPCQGYLDKSFVKDKFECVYCRLNKDDGNDDASIVPVRQLKTQNTLIKFRFLAGCVYKYQKIPNEIYEIYQMALESKVKILREKSASSKFSIDPIFLNDAFKCHYKRFDPKRFKDIPIPRLSNATENKKKQS